MTYFLLQLHFYLYTHQKMVDDYLLPLVLGMAVGLILFA